MVEICVEAAKAAVPVIAGAGSNSTREAIEFTRHAKEAGADAVLSVAPYYNKPTQEGLVPSFCRHRGGGRYPDHPLQHSGPQRGRDLGRDAWRGWRRFPNIIGVKDATGNLARASRDRAALPKNFIRLSGDDATSLGFHGPWRAGLYFRDVQCRAQALCGIPEGVPVRRFRDRTRSFRTG